MNDEIKETVEQPEEIEVETKETESHEEIPAPENSEIDYKAKVEELTKALADAKNDYYKAYADAENRKKRLQQDFDTQVKYRIQSFALDILPAIDNFERALDVKTDDEAVKTYVMGFKMIYDQMMNALKKEGLEPIEAVGKPFDPNFHHAIMTEKVEGMDGDMVIMEMQKGYKLKDRVIRASMVKVSE